MRLRATPRSIAASIAASTAVPARNGSKHAGSNRSDSARWRRSGSRSPGCRVVAVLAVGLTLASCSSSDPQKTAVTSVAEVTVPPETSVPEIPTPRLSWPALKVGDRSDHVRVLQYLLSANSIKITPDGRFGTKTKAAMNEFQRRQKLAPSDVMNDETWLRLATTVTASSSPDQIKALQVALTIKNYPATTSGTFDQALTDLVSKSRTDSGSPTTGAPTVGDWLTLLGTGA